MLNVLSRKSVAALTMTALLLNSTVLARSPQEDDGQGALKPSVAVKMLDQEIAALDMIMRGQKTIKDGTFINAELSTKLSTVGSLVSAVCTVLSLALPVTAPVCAPIAAVAGGAPYGSKGIGTVVVGVGEEIEDRGLRAVPALSASEAISLQLQELFDSRDALYDERRRKIDHPGFFRKLLEKILPSKRLKRLSRTRKEYDTLIDKVNKEIDSWLERKSKVVSMPVYDWAHSPPGPERDARMKRYRTDLWDQVDFYEEQIQELHRRLATSPNEKFFEDIVKRKQDQKKRLVENLLKL